MAKRAKRAKPATPAQKKTYHQRRRIAIRKKLKKDLSKTWDVSTFRKGGKNKGAEYASQMMGRRVEAVFGQERLRQSGYSPQMEKWRQKQRYFLRTTEKKVEAQDIILVQVHDSSNIASIEYNPLKEILTVGFLSGHVYEYYGVPVNVVKRFVNAPSRGRYHYYQIRTTYQYRKIA